MSSTGLFLFFFFHAIASAVICRSPPPPHSPAPPLPPRAAIILDNVSGGAAGFTAERSHAFVTVCQPGGPGILLLHLAKSNCACQAAPPPPHPFPLPHTHTHTLSQGGRQHTCNERDSLGKDAPDAIRAASLPESELFQRAQLHGVSYQFRSF